jgi:hypothetical protein
MKYELTYFHCGDQFRRTLAAEIAEVESVVASVQGDQEFHYDEAETTHDHQRAYNNQYRMGPPMKKTVTWGCSSPVEAVPQGSRQDH